MDGYDLHFYNWNLENFEQKETEFDERDWDLVITGCLELDEVIQEQAALIREGIEALPEEEGFFKTPKPDCDLIIGEWGNWHGAAFSNRPALYQQCTMRDAITTALTLDILHKNCESVKMACVAQTVNVLNSLFLTEGETCILTPNYDVFNMYKVHREGLGLETVGETSDKTFIFASEKEEGIFVNLINADMEKDQEIVIAFSDEVQYVSGQILESEDPHDCNTKEEPDKIREKTGKAPSRRENDFAVRLPKASIQVMHFVRK